MRPPKCRLCGKEHWSSQPHSFPDDLPELACALPVSSGFAVTSVTPRVTEKPVTKAPVTSGTVTRPVTPATSELAAAQLECIALAAELAQVRADLDSALSLLAIRNVELANRAEKPASLGRSRAAYMREYRRRPKL